MAVREKKRAQTSSVLLRQPRAVTATFAALILAATYFLLIGPLLETTAPGRENDLRLRTAEAEAKEAEAAATRTAIVSYRTLDQQTKNKIDTAVPLSPKVPLLISAIDASAQAAGMRTYALDVNETVEGLKGIPDAGVLSIALNVAGGDYLALKRLLTSLEHSLRLMDVVAIAFSPESASYTVNLRTYYLKKVGAAPAATGAAAVSAATP